MAVTQKQIDKGLQPVRLPLKGDNKGKGAADIIKQPSNAR